MNKETKKELIKEAIREYQQEVQKIKKKKVYHNTELLMKHYNELKQHSENAIYDVAQVFEEEFLCDMLGSEYDDDGNLRVGTVLKSKIKTTIMVQHIDMALSILKNNAYKNGYDDKYNAFADIYLEVLSYGELVTKYNCTEMTIRRWKNEMIERLGILLFGEEGLILAV